VASAKGRQCSALAAVDWDDQQRQHDTPDEEALLERDATVVLSLSEPKSAPVPELVASNILSLKKPCIPTWVARESNLVIEAGLLPAAVASSADAA